MADDSARAEYFGFDYALLHLSGEHFHTKTALLTSKGCAG